jgi:hypothetical protein
MNKDDDEETLMSSPAEWLRTATSAVAKPVVDLPQRKADLEEDEESLMLSPRLPTPPPTKPVVRQSATQAPTPTPTQTQTAQTAQMPTHTTQLNIEDQVLSLAKAHALQQAQVQADEQAKAISKTLLHALTIAELPKTVATEQAQKQISRDNSASADLGRWSKYLEQSIPEKIFQVLEEIKRAEKDKNVNHCLEEITQQLHSLPYEINTKISEGFDEVVEAVESNLYSKLQDELGGIGSNIIELQRSQEQMMMLMEEMMEKINDSERKVDSYSVSEVDTESDDDGTLQETTKIAKAEPKPKPKAISLEPIRVGMMNSSPLRQLKGLV